MFNDTTTPLRFLQTRRSGKPRDLTAPGPSKNELAEILKIAMRVPDHGKLAPWRFVIVSTEQRTRLAAVLQAALAKERPSASQADHDACLQFASQAPALVVVLSKLAAGHKIPEWEQELSAGAACMNLLLAAHAMGFVGGWLTGWPAYSNHVRDAFGDNAQKIAGFVFIGTPARALEERPRPAYDNIVSEWG